MKKLKIFGFSVMGLLVAGFILAASNDFTDFWTIKGRENLTNTAIAWIDSTRDFVLYDGDAVLGGKGSQPSLTAGEYPGVKVVIKNCGSTAWVQGNLIVATNTANGCGVLGGATNALTTWVGISEGAVAAGAIGYITVEGYALALTTQTVVAGNVLVSTAGAAGYLAANATPTTGSDVAVALSTGTSGGGLTLVLLR